MGVMHSRFAFVREEIFAAFWFLDHTFGSRYGRKAIKGSKDSDGSLVSTKTLGQNKGSLDWRPGPDKVG